MVEASYTMGNVQREEARVESAICAQDKIGVTSCDLPEAGQRFAEQDPLALQGASFRRSCGPSP